MEEQTNPNDRILEVKIDSLKELNNLKFNGIEVVLLRMEKDNFDRKQEDNLKHLELEKRLENHESIMAKDRERTDIKLTGLQKIVWMSCGAVAILAFTVPLLVQFFWR